MSDLRAVTYDPQGDTVTVQLRARPGQRTPWELLARQWLGLWGPGGAEGGMEVGTGLSGAGREPNALGR